MEKFKCNITNFWNASIGVWNEINEIPDGFTLFSKSGKSSYYKNEDETEVIRVSDHWGSGIRMCNWYLNDFRNNSFLFSKNNNGKLFIGKIKLNLKF